MEWSQMSARRRLIEVAVMACTLAGAISIHSFAAMNPTPYDSNNDPVTSSSMWADHIAPDPASKEQPLTGNPLWGVPLRSLSATRERPIFVPSRRPAAPPAVAVTHSEPTKQAISVEPERPALSLVGVVTGSGDSFAVFISNSTHDTIRLQTGEGHDGWVLTSVQAREAVLEKDRQTAVFELPQSTGDRK
jgi:general secretion pathway protein N